MRRIREMKASAEFQDFLAKSMPELRAYHTHCSSLAFGQAPDEHISNAVPVQIAVPISDNLHPITGPAVDSEGNIFVTFSGTRGQKVPVSIFRVDREFQQKPFVRDLPNASGLAFGPDGYLYCSSRAEGTVYRISPEGAAPSLSPPSRRRSGRPFARMCPTAPPPFAATAGATGASSP